MPLWLVVASVLLSAENCECRGCATDRRSATTGSDASTSFAVTSADRRFSADQVARIAEVQRTHLYWHWRGEKQPPAWIPKCQIVVHATRASYAAAIGRGGEATFGSSLIDNRDGVCRARRVDLLADRLGELSALPHELTHVTISEMLGGRTPPRWLDEGIALLADSADKQERHAKDLAAATARRLHFRASDLMQLGGYPPPSRIPAFYAQSGSLVAFLARRREPAKLLAFAERAHARGYDAALREIYELDGIPALEAAWLADQPQSLAYAQARSRAISD